MKNREENRSRNLRPLTSIAELALTPFDLSAVHM